MKLSVINNNYKPNFNGLFNRNKKTTQKPTTSETDDLYSSQMKVLQQLAETQRILMEKQQQQMAQTQSDLSRSQALLKSEIKKFQDSNLDIYKLEIDELSRSANLQLLKSTQNYNEVSNLEHRGEKYINDSNGKQTVINGFKDFEYPKGRVSFSVKTVPEIFSKDVIMTETTGNGSISRQTILKNCTPSSSIQIYDSCKIQYNYTNGQTQSIISEQKTPTENIIIKYTYSNNKIKTITKTIKKQNTERKLTCNYLPDSTISFDIQNSGGIHQHYKYANGKIS